MATVTLTEYNQRPSRIARLARHEDVVITDRGQPVLRLSRIDQPPSRRDALIASGVISRPARRRIGPLPRTTTSPEVARSIIEEWEAERELEY
jgi:antitoxin (DNA-binding transcriptional repressor) of toxin-antitoxin stability system